MSECSRRKNAAHTTTPRRTDVPAHAALGAVLLTALLVPLSAIAQGAAPAPDNATPATYVGEKACATCHALENKHFGPTQHAKIFRLNPRNERERQVCEACHGPGSNHVKDPVNRDALISFTREWGTPIEKQTDTCLACHQGGQRMHWPGSIHATNKLSCSDCHNGMAKFSANGLLKKASITETCYTCHAQQRAEFRKRSHMPVPEGKMSCVDCHNPHGTTTRTLLKADSVNEVCYACHAERRGPFLWEHAPVRENCMNCHTPHGSNQDRLLQVARPFLCQQCHGNTFHPSTLYNTGQSVGGGAVVNSRALGRSCQNCHSQIHGSNHPGGARFQR
jgi:DmsE family decaheme c-type cytochrome